MLSAPSRCAERKAAPGKKKALQILLFKQLLNCHYRLGMSVYFQTTLILDSISTILSAGGLWAKFLVCSASHFLIYRNGALKPPSWTEAPQVDRQTDNLQLQKI